MMTFEFFGENDPDLPGMIRVVYNSDSESYAAYVSQALADLYTNAVESGDDELQDDVGLTLEDYCFTYGRRIR